MPVPNCFGLLCTPNMQQSYQIYLAGDFITTNEELVVSNPYDNQVWTKTYLANHEHVEVAIKKGIEVQHTLKHLPTYEKANALTKIANGIYKRQNEFAEALTRETAKPITTARGEVERAVQTFLDAAEECKRIYGEWMALDRHPSGKGHEAIIRRFPIGLVSAIAPFNFPLNLVAHKLAPAIAAGCPIVLKPASKTPISALLLAQLIDETSLPKGVASILPMDRETGDILVTDDRFKLLTFTGSPSVGWDMKSRAGKKPVVLELGGNAGLIVTETANVEVAVQKSLVGGFSFAGQSCIHTQRIYVHDSVFHQFSQKFIGGVEKLNYGDPLNEDTNISAMIDEKNAQRIDSWVKDAVAQGAQILSGGKREGEAGYLPTVLTNTKSNMLVCSEEAFAPIVVLEKYHDFKQAISHVNDSTFGLQAGIFTDSAYEISYAYDELDVGGVVINNVPTFRADHMPYGGVKDSGLGREGVRYAIEDMTELRTLVINKNT